jgi:hypothetical protein
MDFFNFICGVVTIASFALAVWLWMRSTMETRELTGTLRSIHDIATGALTEADQMIDVDFEVSARKSEKALGCLSNIRILTEKYVKDGSSEAKAAHFPLIEQGVLWTMGMVWKIELSRGTVEIWLYTPDLKPDSTDQPTGKAVHSNLKLGKKYVYFYPKSLPHSAYETAKLLKNIGLDETGASDLKGLVTLIALEDGLVSRLGNRNTIFYFKDRDNLLRPRCFEEMKFTKVPTRGAYWQEHQDETANELHHLLAEALRKQTQGLT